MSNFNLVTDARLAQGSYFSNNQSNTAVIDGWKPVYVYGTSKWSDEFKDTVAFMAKAAFKPSWRP